jgi:hypothetical protein
MTGLTREELRRKVRNEVFRTETAARVGTPQRLHPTRTDCCKARSNNRFRLAIHERTRVGGRSLRA